MTTPPLHTLGMHANHMSRNCGSERMQTILQWVGVGSVILMGAAAAVHLYRDLNKPMHDWKPDYRRRSEMPDEVERCYGGQCRSR